jgi:endo-1,4-beta-D-glucanase Y
MDSITVNEVNSYCAARGSAVRVRKAISRAEKEKREVKVMRNDFRGLQRFDSKSMPYPEKFDVISRLSRI